MQVLLSTFSFRDVLAVANGHTILKTPVLVWSQYIYADILRRNNSHIKELKFTHVIIKNGMRGFELPPKTLLQNLHILARVCSKFHNIFGSSLLGQQ
jgi:hypothetical protein